MQLILLACLAVVASAAPQLAPLPVAILRDDRQDNGDGNFQYTFESENGISVSASGSPGSQGQANIQGSYLYPLEDGTFAEVRYVADEFGFRPESPLLPTTPPVPAHVPELLRIAEEQRAAGITFE
ncbi:hypothetical protein Pcinc_004174 [Petrolisthes cinctipes]|uniref:Uncharacterized protein n=1 Tax=Petrolisthes cinctipes TaxID=88211 RepID=A0AAE1GF79_PETCI|nr:hypothetical protein Pcinc_004174 [Petrolisthes cinctipes]